MTIVATLLINFFIWLVVLGIVFWLLLYLVNTVPMFAPFREVARVILTVFACLILILLLLRLLGLVSIAAPLWQ